MVLATDSADTLRKRFEALLTRSDPLPFGEAVAVLMPAAVARGVAAEPNDSKRALLVVGSPKTNSPTASSALGGYLLDRLHDRRWDTESLTLRASLNRAEGEAALVSSIDRAGLILLVFPLYADALPYLVTKALAVIAAHRQAGGSQSPQRLVAIVNSGFPETHQNSVALAICQEFASQTGITWAGGLALGGGGIVAGQPLTATKRSGPSVKHVVRALDLTAEALAAGHSVPAEAVRLMAKTPIPFVPFALWRWLYIQLGGKGFERLAAQNGVSKYRLLDQPYAA